MKRTFILSHQQARQRTIEAIKNAPDGYSVTLEEPRRTLDQNAALWPLLQAFSEQLEWQVNGKMTKMSPDDWKDILTAAFGQENTRIVPGLDGRLVILGMKTSKMSKRQFSDFLEFIHATAAEKGISFEPLPA